MIERRLTCHHHVILRPWAQHDRYGYHVSFN